MVKVVNPPCRNFLTRVNRCSSRWRKYRCWKSWSLKGIKPCLGWLIFRYVPQKYTKSLAQRRTSSSCEGVSAIRFLSIEVHGEDMYDGRSRKIIRVREEFPNPAA